MKIRIRNSENGFTLLEVLIALAILAVSLVSLYVAQGNSLLVSGTADRLTVATFLAEQQMTEWQIALEAEMAKGELSDEDKEETGQFEEPYSDYRWERRFRKIEIPIVLPETDDGQQKQLFHLMKSLLDQIAKSAREIRVRVYWGDDEDHQEDYTLTTHVVKLK